MVAAGFGSFPFVSAVAADAAFAVAVGVLVAGMLADFEYSSDQTAKSIDLEEGFPGLELQILAVLPLELPLELPSGRPFEVHVDLRPAEPWEELCRDWRCLRIQTHSKHTCASFSLARHCYPAPWRVMKNGEGLWI